MVRSVRAFEEKGSAAAGHNKATDKEKKKFTDDFIALCEQEIELRGKKKALLQKAKDSGILKTAIRNAAKIVQLTEEQYQSKNEVEAETRAIVQLYAGDDGQYSWLNDAA